MSIKRTRFLAAATIASVAGLASSHANAGGAAATGGTVLLQTATKLVYEAPDGKVSKQQGAGAMDAHLATDASGLIFMTWTHSVPTQNNDGAGIQGAVALYQLTDKGLTTVKDTTVLPTLQGERDYMRPNAAVGSKYMMTIFATEDNGVTNNPQSAGWVFDRSGAMVPITNSTRQNKGAADAKPTNLITLGLKGQNDAQQWGPHSVCPIGTDAATGGDAFLVGMQRNNQSAWVAKVVVTADGAGAKVTVPFLTKFVNNAQHTRPQIACPPPGVTDRSVLAVTSVEANNQPADIGIRIATIDTKTGQVLKNVRVQQVVRDTATGKTIHTVQPSLAYISNDVVALQWQKSAGAANRNGGNNNNGNGHTGGENLSMLTSYKLTDLSKVDEMEAVAPYQRHGRSFGTMYGAGEGAATVAMMGGSSTGTGKGLLQMVNVDATTGKLTAADRLKDLYQVSTYSDVAALQVRGKRNPNNQGCGFLNGLGGLTNPGFGKADGFMPEVKTFTLAAVPGYKTAAAPGTPQTAGQRESLYLSLIPATWDPSKNTAPGSVTDSDNVKPGPSPTTGGSSGATGSNGGTGSSPDMPTTGYGQQPEMTDSSGGCSMSSTKESTGGMTGILITLGLTIAAIRRNKKSEEK
jgi:hypothetical protein